MPRPRGEMGKKVRSLKKEGMSVTEIQEVTGLSRNTVFYHLREAGRDRRVKYTREQRRIIAQMKPEQLQEVAAKLGISYMALQRVAYRERKSKYVEHSAKLELQGFLSFGESMDLKAYGMSLTDIIHANEELRKYGLHLESPNRLVHTSGKWQPLKIEDQISILTNTNDYLHKNAGRLKTQWRTYDLGDAER